MSSQIIKCKATTAADKPCKYKSILRGYCGVHSKIYKYDKPDECAICFETLEYVKTPLECGHWIHKECIQLWGKNVCPLCKVVLTKFKIKPTRSSQPYGEMIEIDLTSETRSFIEELIRHFEYNIGFDYEN